MGSQGRCFTRCYVSSWKFRGTDKKNKKGVRIMDALQSDTINEEHFGPDDERLCNPHTWDPEKRKPLDRRRLQESVLQFFMTRMLHAFGINCVLTGSSPSSFPNSSLMHEQFFEVVEKGFRQLWFTDHMQLDIRIRGHAT